jgi:hypothetical protein
MRRAILSLLLLAGAPAWADLQRVGLHLGTVHHGQGFEDFNPGAYAVWDGGATLGAYRNSEGAPSAYLGWTWEAGPLGLTAMAVTGYRRAPVLPGLIPSLCVPLAGGLGARVSLILAPEKRARAVHFSVEYDL